MKMYIPNSVWLGNIDPFLEGLDLQDPQTLDISFHPKWASVHPMVLAMIAAIGIGVDSSRINCKITTKSKHYFERMGLFNFLGIDSGMQIAKHESTGRFIPLTQIKTSPAITDFINEMTPLLHLEPQQAEPIRYIMSELIRNVLEHAQSHHGAIVCAQYYKKSNTVRIGIADTGRGIWKSMQKFHHPKDDLDALRLALTPGITGTTSKEGGTDWNAGAGLFFIKSIASVNNDFLAIYSGSALYKLLKKKSKKMKLHADPFDDRHSSRDNLPKWQGTCVGVDLSLNQTQEFSDLLGAFRDVWSRAIKERKRARYIKPQFI